MFVMLVKVIVVQRHMYMDMLMVGMPVKIVVGLVALALWVPEMGGVLTRIYDAIYTTWNLILAGAASSLPATGRVC